MKIKILAVALMAFAQAGAATQTLKTSVSGTSFDWADGSNYKSGTAPAAGDTVVIPANVEARVSAGTDSYTLVSSLNRITPQPGATLRVTVDADASPATLGCAVSANKQTDYSGCLLKDGAGELELTANGKVKSGSAYYDYQCAFKVQSGTVKFVRAGVDKSSYYYGKVDVAEGATVFVCPLGYTHVTSFVGYGMVTNDATAKGPQVWIDGKDGDSFYGTIGGKFIPLYVAGDWNLMNAEQSYSGSVIIRGGGTFGVGELTKNGKSVFGVGSPNFGGDGATLAFRGTEATSSSAPIWTTTSQVLDGGAFGGVTWTGKISATSSSKDLQQLLVLSGSNTTECVLQNQFVRNGDTGSYYVTKRGTGTWRFGDYEQRTLDGVIAVEEGTLRYDTIAPRGTACSLGTANLLYECKAGATSGLKTVPYAYLLGGDGTEGLMEYAGTNIVTCSDRPFAVRSQGGLRAQTGMTQFAGFTTADDDATLVLAGTNLYENTVSCVTNGAGVLSLLKKDSGLWVLDGNNDFSGSLVVSNGTLIVRKPELKYSYYQLVIKANGYTADWYVKPAKGDSNGKTIVVRNWGLFDANGVRQNVFSHAVADCTNGVEDTRFILPGQYGYYGENKADIKSNPTRHLGGMFYDGNNWTQASYGLTYTNKPNSWVRIGCRMPYGTPAIVSTDIMNTYGNGADYSGRNVAAWQLEASVDGKSWDIVAKDDQVAFPANGGVWDYGPNHKALDRTAPASVPATSPLAGNPIVSVAPGAKLALEGDITVSRLALSADGVGTIEGGALAETGTLYVDDSVGTGNPVATDFRGTTGVGNLRGWTVNVNGTPTRRRVRVDANGRITICPVGLVFIIR